MIQYNQVTIILLVFAFIFTLYLNSYCLGSKIGYLEEEMYSKEEELFNIVEGNYIFRKFMDKSKISNNLLNNINKFLKNGNKKRINQEVDKNIFNNTLNINENNKIMERHHKKRYRNKRDSDIFKYKNDYETKPFYILIPLPEKANEAPECKYRNPFNLDLLSVRPVVEEAIEDIQNKIFPNRKIQLIPFFNDTKCSDAIGPNYAVELYKQDKLDCIIGYAFVYSLATISRLSTQWKNGIPIISPIGLTSNLDNKTEYKYLTRITGSYKGVGSATSKIMKTINITNVLFLLHEPRLVRTQDIPYSECFHIIGSLIYELVNNNDFIKKQDSYDVIDETLHNITVYKEKLKKLSVKGNETYFRILHGDIVSPTLLNKYIFF